MGLINKGTTAAIIAEYNPFHNGHRLHIARTRELCGAENIVVIMSGNFVQRGDCALCDKFSRTRMALAGGADLVLQLPLPFACAGAEKFARGGVTLADALGCVDYLSFGTESGDIRPLIQAAEALSDESWKTELDRLLAGGMSFAAARAEALRRTGGDDLAEAIATPNNILAVEYIRAIGCLQSGIRPLAISREGAPHDSDTPSGGLASASVLRSMIADGRLEDAADFMPEESFRLLRSLINDGTAPADITRCERAILASLRTMTREHLAGLPDVSEGLENRISDCARTASSLNGLYDAVKTKRYSHARIRRIILSSFLGVRRDHSDSPRCIRILGMNEKGKRLLSAARPRLPLITSYRQAASLPEQAREQYLLECRADDLWSLMTPRIQPCGSDMTTGLIVYSITT